MDNARPEADWRPVVAALANPHARLLYARIVVGEREPAGLTRGVPAAKARNALHALERAGLVREHAGSWVDTSDVLTGLLAAAATPRAPGVERYLDGRGRIDRYPTDAADLRELLEFVAARVLAAGEVVTERELTERLAPFGPDTAALRRAMVDAEVLERTRSGSEYARVAQASAEPSR